MKKLLPVLVLLCGAAFAETPATVRLFELTCVSCHGKAQTPPIPDPAALRQMTPEAIYQVLNADRQHLQALPKLTDAEKRDVAEYASGRQLMEGIAAEAGKMPNVCKANPPITSLTSSPAWNGWSADRTNGRFQTSASAGLTKAQIPRLKLKWAFGFPGATSVHGQPAIAARARVRRPEQRLHLFARRRQRLRVLVVPGAGGRSRRHQHRRSQRAGRCEVRRLLRRRARQRLRARCRDRPAALADQSRSPRSGQHHRRAGVI